MHRKLAAIGLGSWIFVAGCAGSGGRSPGAISHPVFAKLKNPADARELIADCDAKIGPLPMIASYTCGVPLDLGRVEVDADYDVGMVVSFATVEDYRAYIAHPDHVWVVTKWKDRLQWLRIYDIKDERP